MVYLIMEGEVMIQIFGILYLLCVSAVTMCSGTVTNKTGMALEIIERTVAQQEVVNTVDSKKGYILANQGRYVFEDNGIVIPLVITYSKDGSNERLDIGHRVDNNGVALSPNDIVIFSLKKGNKRDKQVKTLAARDQGLLPEADYIISGDLYAQGVAIDVVAASGTQYTVRIVGNKVFSGSNPINCLYMVRSDQEKRYGVLESGKSLTISGDGSFFARPLEKSMVYLIVVQALSSSMNGCTQLNVYKPVNGVTVWQCSQEKYAAVVDSGIEHTDITRFIEGDSAPLAVGGGSDLYIRQFAQYQAGAQERSFFYDIGPS